MFKLRSKQIVLPIAVLLLVVGTALAQPLGIQQEGAGRQGMHGCRMSEHKPMIPDLTEEQREQIKTLRTEHMKAVQPMRNQIGEKKARLRTLTTSDKVNMSEVDRVIEDIGKIKTEMMKLMAQHRQEIRRLLNDEQRVFFDAHHHPHDRRGHEGMH
jgi:Spy/CpxP family protein refolding chaperone